MLAGLIFDQSIHYIDHLAPFCTLYNLPLIVCDEIIAELCRQYYPGLSIIENDPLHLQLSTKIVCCEPARLVQLAFPHAKIQQLFWLPHGNSDKGWKKPYFQALQSETALVYGQKMVDLLQAQKIQIPMIRIGNFRLQYWKQHREFYDRMLDQTDWFDRSKRIYLYAPTWEDVESNSSFWFFSSRLFEAVPKDCLLLVKIHPNMQRQNVAELERLRGKAAAYSAIRFIDLFPPIYPLLNRCNAYIGDMSSIGYDFLYWNRPMYFFNPHPEYSKTDPSLFLYRCGKEVFLDSIESIFRQEQDHLPLLQLRKQIYDYTFDRSPEYGTRLPLA